MASSLASQALHLNNMLQQRNLLYHLKKYPPFRELEGSIMKHKYITTKILLACLAKKPAVNKDIHAQLQETIAEHKRIMQQFAQIFLYEEEDDFVTQYKIAA